MELIRLRTKILKPNFDLLKECLSSLIQNKQLLKNGDVLIVNSKIIAVSQNQVVELDTQSTKNKKNMEPKSHYGVGTEDPNFVAVVNAEADVIVPGHMLLTIKDGIFTPAAGIDRSNTPEGTVVLWPKDVWKVAAKLQSELKRACKIQKLGVVICDSTCAPLRAGTTGVALAWAGFEGVEDVRGAKDLYKKPLTVTRRAMADNLAAAAQLLMGEAAERTPLVIARNSPVKFTNKKQKSESLAPKDCLYSGLYGNIL